MKKIKSYHVTIVCFILGAMLGLIVHKELAVLQLIGDLFVRLIKLAVVPLVFTAIVNSVLNIHGANNGKKMAGLVLGIFTLSTAISSAVGVINALIVRPGGSSVVVDTTDFAGSEIPTFSEFVLNLVPSNPFAALVEGNTFHIILIAAVMGIIILIAGKSKMSTICNFFEELNEIIMKYIEFMAKTIPVGVFALTATSFAKFGSTMLSNLMKYFITIVVSIIVIYCIYFIVLCIFSRGTVKEAVKGLSKIWIVAASTSSSAATLPISMQTSDELKIDKKISRFVLPLGITMNMNGAAQYMAVTFIFIAQVYGTTLNIGDLLLAIFLVTILVMATPGIPGGAMVPTTILLATFNIPIEMFAIVLGLYSIVDMLDTTLNVTGDIVTSIVVQKLLKNKN